VVFSESQGELDSAPGTRAASPQYGRLERRPEDLHCPAPTLADVGSGAGFPGIPIKLCAPQFALTLIESQNKKATFLREAIRTLGLKNAEIFCGRAEQWDETADLVTLRAVEQFERALAVAAKLVGAGGMLCLLIGTGQVSTGQETLGADWTWRKPNVVPQSTGRVVLVGSRR
jgi:16S rRNA (guanine527-N7)-methyltransferase